MLGVHFSELLRVPCPMDVKLTNLSLTLLWGKGMFNRKEKNAIVETCRVDDFRKLGKYEILNNSLSNYLFGPLHSFYAI